MKNEKDVSYQAIHYAKQVDPDLYVNLLNIVCFYPLSYISVVLFNNWTMLIFLSKIRMVKIR